MTLGLKDREIGMIGAVTYWLVKEDWREEIIEDFSDLWVILNVLLVTVNEFILEVSIEEEEYLSNCEVS